MIDREGPADACTWRTGHRWDGAEVVSARTDSPYRGWTPEHSERQPVTDPVPRVMGEPDSADR